MSDNLLSEKFPDTLFYIYFYIIYIKNILYDILYYKYYILYQKKKNENKYIFFISMFVPVFVLYRRAQVARPWGGAAPR